jgi:CRP-like cAMP-binding protein
MAEPPRRFPAPWRADLIPGGYVVRDANGQALAYLYSRDNDAEARQAKVLTRTKRDESPSTSRGGRSCQGMRASDIANALKIGRASVYRVLGQRADKEAAP